MNSKPFLHFAVSTAIVVYATASSGGELHEAAKTGDLQKVKALVAKGDVDAKDDQGATALMWASAYGNGEIVEFLLSKGADLNATTNDGTAALHVAVRYGENGVCKTLIRAGAGIDKRISGFHNRTPLHLAIFEGRTETAQLLIAEGANVNARDTSGMVPDTPLAMAAWKGQKGLVKLLQSKGAVDEWLSNVPGYDLTNVAPVTLEKDADGNIKVGAWAFILARGFAKRPWALPPESQRSKTGNNLFRWVDPRKDKGPLVCIVYSDARGSQTLVSIVPTICIGEKGILYRQGETKIEKDGPFADVVIADPKNDIAEIVIRRHGGKSTKIGKPKDGEWKLTLGQVKDYEPIFARITRIQTADVISVDFDCVFRSATKGNVIYHVRPQG